MSAKSDAHEFRIADAIKTVVGDENAERPKASTSYSDVRFRLDPTKPWFWLEVKMNHSDNLMNLRFSYHESKWTSPHGGPGTQMILDSLTGSATASQFVSNVAELSQIPVDKVTISSNRGELANPNCVPLATMRSYFTKPDLKVKYGVENRYIVNESNADLGKAATLHYTHGKAEPVYYLQAGDSFLMFGNTNPLGFQGVPELSGEGPVKVRVSTRSKFYEIQMEVKLNGMPESDYSLLPGTKKRNPFTTL